MPVFNLKPKVPLPSWSATSGTILAKAGDRLILNTTSAESAITLPGSPTVGDSVEIGIFGQYKVSISGNGKLIRGKDSLLALPRPDIITLIYASGEWKLLATAGSCLARLHELSYASPGDTNGVFYGLGSEFGGQAWANPYPFKLTVATSPTLQVGTLDQLTDRTSTPNWGISGNSNSWVSFDLGVGNALILNRYTIRHRSSFASAFIRNWKLQGSNDAINWEDLDVRVNDTSINALDGWFSGAVTIARAFRYFRILQIGVDSENSGAYLVLGEVEIYGSFGTLF